MASAQNRKFIGDKESATYRWELYLSSGNGYIFDGYSKSVGMAEKLDKQQLLQDCICRLLNNGYLDKTYQMHFYKREFMHKSQDTLILAMYPTYFTAHNGLELDLSTCNFLERIYAARQSGEGLNYKELLPPRDPRKHREKETSDFKFSLDRFPSKESLVLYCREYLIKNYTRTRVEAWYHKVRHAYGSENLPTPSSTVRLASAPDRPTGSRLPASPDTTFNGAPGVVHDPDNLRTQQNAMNALNAFQAKYQSNR